MIESLAWLYPWLKAGHILAAIVAVGFNVSYAILIRRAAAEPQHLGHVLRTVRVLDERFANPAYGMLFVLGLLMVLIGFPDISDLWVWLAIILVLTATVLGFAIYPRCCGGRSRQSRARARNRPSIGRWPVRRVGWAPCWAGSWS